jgi:hypothetical protein
MSVPPTRIGRQRSEKDEVDNLPHEEKGCDKRPTIFDSVRARLSEIPDPERRILTI